MNKEERKKIHDLVDQIIDLVNEEKAKSAFKVISNVREPDDKIVFVLTGYN